MVVWGRYGLDMQACKDQNRTPIVRFLLLGAGRGHKSSRNDPDSSIVNESMNWFEVSFESRNRNCFFRNFRRRRNNVERSVSERGF